MNSDENSTGCVTTSDHKKRELARGSLEWNMNNDKIDGFVKRFEPVFDKLGINQKVIESSKVSTEIKQEEDSRKSFFILSVIAITVSYFISVKFFSAASQTEL